MEQYNYQKESKNTIYQNNQSLKPHRKSCENKEGNETSLSKEL